MATNAECPECGLWSRLDEFNEYWGCCSKCAEGPHTIASYADFVPHVLSGDPVVIDCETNEQADLTWYHIKRELVPALKKLGEVSMSHVAKSISLDGRVAFCVNSSETAQ